MPRQGGPNKPRAGKREIRLERKKEMKEKAKEKVKVHSRSKSKKEEGVDPNFVRITFVVSKRIKDILEKFTVKFPLTVSRVTATMLEHELLRLGLLSEAELLNGIWYSSGEIEAYAMTMLDRRRSSEQLYMQYVNRAERSRRERATNNLLGKGNDKGSDLDGADDDFSSLVKDSDWDDLDDYDDSSPDVNADESGVE